jgi:hypothetical protein
MAGRSRARPAPTTNDTRLAVMFEALALSSSSTMARRRSAGSIWSVSALRSSSEPSMVRENRNSSSLTSSTLPSALATSNNALA